MKIKSKFISNRNKLLKVKPKLKRNERFARKLIEEKYKSLSLKNKELVEENASLLAQNEILKKEKLDIYKNLIDLMTQQKRPNNNNINKDLLQILETIRSDYKKMQQLFEKSYNQIIDKISADIKQLIDSNSDENLNPVSVESTGSAINSDVNRNSESHESRGHSFQRIKHLYHNNFENLSVIQEQTNERITQSTQDTVQTVAKQDISDHEVSQRPQTLENRCDSSSHSFQSQYEITPHFGTERFGTPSIYNFDCETIANQSDDISDDYQLINTLEFTSLDSEVKVTDEQTNAISTSTPYSSRKSFANTNQRPSKRISSIALPFSPLSKRSSLINIQNVFDNRQNVRRSSISKSEGIINSIVSNTNDTKSMKSTAKKRKKCINKSNSKSFASETSESNQSTESNRSSRRNRIPVSYKEPPLNRKIRREDQDWLKNKFV